MDTRRRLAAWFARHRALVVDCAVAAALIVLWTAMTTPVINDAGLLFRWDPTPALPWSVLLTAPYALHRVRPALATNLFLCVVFAQLVVGPALVAADVMALPMLYAALVYGDAARTRRYLAWAGALCVAAGVVSGLANYVTPLGEWVRWWLGGALPEVAIVCSVDPDTGAMRTPASCGTSVAQSAVMLTLFFAIAVVMVCVAAFWQRARRQTVLLLAERNRAIEARQEEEQRIAAAAERARIARDMHDVVAHTLSIIIVQADGGRYATVDDPAAACATMETIRGEAGHALDDMTRLLGVFGGTLGGGYGDVDALLAQARAASADMAVARAVEGTPAPALLSPAASVALYHVAQEALTNARKYAGTHVRVEVREEWGDDGVTVTVRDDGRGAAAALDGHVPGMGLTGMRERVEAAGGTLAAGPANGGGFLVTAVLPLGDDAGDTSPGLRVDDGEGTPRDGATAEGMSVATGADDDAPRQSGMRALGSRLAALRSRPFEQAAAGAHASWVTRLSHWTERHYVLTDTLAVAAITAFMLVNDLGVFTLVAWAYDGKWWATLAATVLLMAPLCLRRRFPRAVAIVFAVLAGLQLVVLPDLYSADFFALLAIYTCALYGRGHEWRWMAPTIVGLSALTGVKVALMGCGYGTLVGALAGRHGAGYDALVAGSGGAVGHVGVRAAAEAGVQFAVVVAMVCMIALLLGAWSRQKGENPQVLAARAEALRAQEDKARVMATNRERDRIGAQIREEVSATLRTVIDQADAELDAIHAQLAVGETPTPESIGDAFAAIAARGRTALARMRTLLRVLRETGFSDEHEDDGHLTMPLSPLAGTRTGADR
ncbi:MAG: histidine kinase [Bifidobacterium sp.]|nr:histidine kinase [Bifidobacterium sp.]